MPKYRVYFAAVAEYTVEVEVGEEDDVIERAFEEADFPFFPAGMRGDVGDWNTLSEVLPDSNDPEDDYELVDDE